MKLKYQFELMELGEQYIAVPGNEDAKMISGIIKMNKSGSEIFRLLENDITEEEIASRLRSNYSSDDISDMVHHFVLELQKMNLLI